MSIDTLTGEIPAGGDEPTPFDRERMRADVAESDLRICEDELRKSRRAERALRAEISRKREQSSEGIASRQIARYYVQRLGKTKTWKFGEKRQKAVIGRLKEEYEPLYICRAIDGLAIGHNTNRDTGVKYDDLELVCRDEVNLERFHQLAEINDAPSLISKEWEKLLNGALDVDSPRLESQPDLTTPPDRPTTERGTE